MIELNLYKKLQSGGRPMELRIGLSIARGELLALFGPSGSGKTSLLRLISGLLSPDDGKITVNGTAWYDSRAGLFVKPQHRKVGYVFQDYALFPNMTVRENLEYALGKGQDPGVVGELLAFTELAALENRMPPTLSGGEKQRVALARALVPQPEILLLDEPLSALDSRMREKLQDYILRIHEEYALTTILVSHDVSEIIKLSGRICELKQGKIIRQGIPSDFFGGVISSAKFRFTGEIIDIREEDVIFVISVRVGNELVKVVADPTEIKDFGIGDKVFVASKAFNPMIRKI